ncbi:hypothetical protein HNR06_003612 [Nocardiopsis arvandica]|uniref:Uncharacterized protein n=1 Tax=Nocardiopsis sinuspersici TaxID=501010 RepID=A0A7Y9XE74_9ACTN|nr:hypothetical protein [Nocardiopsis sinuspersici]NYH54023.1 hypothetical protein [Nocardiopsis sinuspersici]
MSTSPVGQDFDLYVRFLDGTPSHLVDVARRYWDLRGLDETGAYPLWRTPVREIDTNGWGGRHHLLAAAASRAVAKGYFCPSCEEELSLPNRTALNKILAGDTRVVCADCHPTLSEEAEEYRDPDAAALRRAERRREEQSLNEAYADAEERWIKAHREVLGKEFPLHHHPEEEFPELDVRWELAALTVVRNAAEGGIINIRDHPELSVLSPDGEDAEVMEALRHHGVLRVHPSSAVSSRVWRVTAFGDAVAEAGGELDGLPMPELTGRYYPLTTRFYVPYGDDLRVAAESAGTRLLRRLTHALKDHRRFDALEGLLTEVIAKEAVRYFDHKLKEHNLPGVPEEKLPRLREAADKLARVRCLGQIYCACWIATRNAAAAAQRTPRAPGVNMTEHGLKSFEDLVQVMVRDDTKYTRAFREDIKFPLSAMTRTLFHTVLDMHPMETGPARIRQMRPAQPARTAPARNEVIEPTPAPPVRKTPAPPVRKPEPELVHPELEEKEFPSVELQARRLAAMTEPWSWQDFATAFQTVREDISLVWDEDHPSHSTLQAATGALEMHLLQLGTYLKERESALAMVLAAGLYRELIGARPHALPSGRVVVGLLVEALVRRGPEEDPTEEGDAG